MAYELNMNLFAKRLKEARSDKNMTQKELSEKSGVSTVMISAYERSNTNAGKNPALNNIYAIATVLGVSIDWLCGLTDDIEFGTHKSCEIDTANLLKAIFYLVDKCNVNLENTNYDAVQRHFYEIQICSSEYAFDFVQDCLKLKPALEVDVLTDEMKENLINGVIEKYLKKVNSADDLFDVKIYDDLPF